MSELVVVGAGAMGGSLAAHAARAGHAVTVVDADPAVVAAISDGGVEVEAPDGTFSADVAATVDPGSVDGPVDVVVLFVKAQHTAAAARAVAPLLGPGTTVVTLQNGWGNADVIAAEVPPGRLVIGVTYNSCTARGPGRVVHSGRGPTTVGPHTGDDVSRASAVAALLDGAGWPATATAGVRTAIWRKLVLNCATLPTAALTRLTAGAVGGPGELRDLVDGVAAEAVAVAAAQGLDVDVDERVAAIHRTLATAGAGRASMLQDVLASRKTEIETVNGAVVALGDELGVPVPLNRALVALVHGLERSYS